MGRKSTTGGVSPLGDRIQITFLWRGKRLRPTLDLKPTAANLKHAARLRDDILDDIKDGTFKLASYFPDYRFIEAHEDAATDTAARTFDDWKEVWATVSSRTMEHSTLKIYKKHLKAYWSPVFGQLRPAKITHEAILLHLARLANEHTDSRGVVRPGLARKTQNNILIPFRGVMALALKGSDTPNPCDGIENLTTEDPPPDPFSQEEVGRILAQFAKVPRVGAVLVDFFTFLFYAGLRVSEQIALLWKDVDLVNGTVYIRRARVMAKDKERTKTHKPRTVELNDVALAVLRRQRERTQLAGAHVFLNPDSGKAWHGDQEVRRVWNPAVALAKVRHRPPKEARDTSVTMALQHGGDVRYVAEMHGHSVQTMMKSYAGWIPKGDGGRNLAAINRGLSSVITEIGFASRTPVDPAGNPETPLDSKG